jgi:3-dehydroquinate dehydratase/shikimate dehydrogenase
LSPVSGPTICVVVGRTRHKMMQIEIQEAVKRGAQFMELRLDFLAKAPDFKRLIGSKPCPMIATVRRPLDGGRWSGNEDERLMLLRQAIVAGFDWVDLETDIIDGLRRYKDVKRIVSYHNFREIPENLEEIYETMCNQDADLVKIAVTALHATDNLRVLKLVQQAKKPTVAFCMGDLGAPSRLLALRFGAPFIYAAFNKERGIAPGIPGFEELRKLYAVEKITSDTAVYGVIGDPVGHSLSPLAHNKAFREVGVNALYLPFRVPRGELPAFLAGFDTIPVQGYSVTIPHKETAVTLAKVIDDPARWTSAANTLVRDEQGWKAYNTDYHALVESLTANLPPAPDSTPVPLSSRTILILGAGGIARAAAHALSRQGAVLMIANRTHERAQRLAEEVGCRAIDWSARHSVLCDILINCTSVGMHPNLDESPIHNSFLKPGLHVFDTIYTPENTLLVKEARERGCHVLTGLDLFVRQAALQFKLFTGREAPLEVMRSTVRRALSPVALRDEDEVKA